LIKNFDIRVTSPEAARRAVRSNALLGWKVRVDGHNLTDSRDPVAESELGDAQFYRLPGRSLLISVAATF
jgi:hypothetical protein